MARHQVRTKLVGPTPKKLYYYYFLDFYVIKGKMVNLYLNDNILSSIVLMDY